jgi:ribose-phosphate pyrophosphokinase
MEQLIMVDALKRASAKRITVVSPFYPYGARTRSTRPRADLRPPRRRPLQDRGRGPLMSIDLHASQIQGFFDGPVDHLSGLPPLAEYVKEKYDTSEMTIVSPDAGRVRLADAWTDKLGARWRSSTSAATPTRPTRWPWRGRRRRQGRVCLLVDDMIDTAGTIAQATCSRARGTVARPHDRTRSRRRR